jgi:Phage protein Gp138 N-terminal domain
MSDQPQTPSLAGVLAGALDARLKGVRVALVCRVETYDAPTQTCSLQPLQYEGYFDETGTRVAEKLPVIASVPVSFPGCGAFSITWPLNRGDTVTMICSSSSLDRWLSLGGEVDPIDDRRHHITDGIAFPGVRDLQHVLPASAMDAAAMVIGGPLKLGDNSASSPAGLNTEFAGFIGVLQAWAPTGTVGDAAALKTALTTFFTGHPGFPVGSTTTKVK